MGPRFARLDIAQQYIETEIIYNTKHITNMRESEMVDLSMCVLGIDECSAEFVYLIRRNVGSIVRTRLGAR